MCIIVIYCINESFKLCYAFLPYPLDCGSKIWLVSTEHVKMSRFTAEINRGNVYSLLQINIFFSKTAQGVFKDKAPTEVV